VELNGTYWVNPDGTVVETTITTLPDGTTLEGQIDHVITQSTGTTATMMNGIVRDASPFVPGVIQVTPGVVQVTRYTRLPDQTTFGNASLQGNYGFFTTIGTNTVLSQMGVNGAAARGTITFDGQGKLAASVVFNIPTPDGTRALVPLSLAGQLTMNADGTGIEHTTVTFPDGTTIDDTLDLVIAQAMGPTATEVIGVFRDPNPFGVQIVRYTLRP
jgi:hypothetical protein